MRERVKLDGLTAARFYAALMIVMFHVAQMPKLTMHPDLIFVSAHFGLGVPLFYTISAFSMFVGYHGRLETREQIRSFFVRRFFRIAPLFYLMMLIYIAYLYARYGVLIPFEKVLSSATFTFNLIPAHVSGFVWASWSIGVEMLFYAAFPVIAFAVTSLPRALIAFALSAFLAQQWVGSFPPNSGVSTFANYSIVSYLVFFSGGIVGYFAWVRAKERWAFPALVTGLVALIALMVFRGDAARAVGMAWLKTVDAIPMLLLVVGLAAYPLRLLVNSVTVRLGETSFSLYLFHPLIIGELMRVGAFKSIYANIQNTGLAYAACVVLTLCILIPVSLVAYRLIETPGNRLAARFIR